MDETNSLVEQRKAKLSALRARGIDPFKNKFTPGETCKHARDNYAEGREVARDVDADLADRRMGQKVAAEDRVVLGLYRAPLSRALRPGIERSGAARNF